MDGLGMVQVIGPKTQAVALAARKDDERPVLKCVRFEEERMAATDGILLLYATRETVPADKVRPQHRQDICFSESIPAEVLTTAAKLAKKPKNGELPFDALAYVSSTEASAHRDGDDHYLRFEAVPDEYPNFAAVIPSSPVITGDIVLQHQYLATIAKAAAKMGSSATVKLAITAQNELLIHIECGNTEDCVDGVMMGMRPNE